MKLENQAYNLGRVYRILEDGDEMLKNNIALLDRAPLSPKATMAEAMRICRANRSITKEADHLIMTLLDDVGLEFPSTCSNELQGCWWIGYYASSKSEYGDKVLFARKAEGLTQQQLAERTNLSQSEISLIERGKITPNMHQKKALSAILGVKFSDEPTTQKDDQRESN